MWYELGGALVLWGLSWVYHRYIEDHPASPRPPALVLPRVDEGAAIPLIYGTARVRTPVLVWSSNYHVPGQSYSWVASTVIVEPGGSATSDNYSVDSLWIVGVPFNGGLAVLSQVWAGDTPFASHIVAPSGGSQPFSCGASILASGLPDSAVLSITGILYQGSSTQDVLDGTLSDGAGPNVYWDGSQTGDTSFKAALLNAVYDITLIPGYRNQVVAYTHIGMAGSPTLSSFSFEVKSLSTGTSADLGHSLAADADPAAVIYDLLTSPWGKLSLPTSAIDLTSFQAASLTLFNEANGYSRVIDQGQDAETIIADILKQIDGVLYPEPTTGKIVLKLIRADYTLASLVDINPSNARPAGADWYSVQSWSELPTQVRVTWTDRIAGYRDAVAIAQNGAAAVAQTRTLRSVSIRYIGCCTESNAEKLAARELAVVSRPMVRVSAIVTRAFYASRPGDVVTFTWPELGITGMVMRVARVDLGQLHKGEIAIDMMRDVFDVSLGAFSIP